MFAVDTVETVVQSVRLACGHEFRYRIWRSLAESGFARPGVRWRCARCDEHGTTTRPITTVHIAPATA